MSDKSDQPHDVLAADEFAVPAPDPGLGTDGVHDVLAAEEFVVPAPDPDLTIASEPVQLPPDPRDPVGADPVHDVLAAEEFAMPAPGQNIRQRPAWRRRVGASGWLVGLAAVGLMLRRRRPRRA